MSKLVEAVVTWVKSHHFEKAFVVDEPGLLHQPDVLKALSTSYAVYHFESGSDVRTVHEGKPQLVLASLGDAPTTRFGDNNVLQAKLTWFDLFGNLHAPTLVLLDGIWLDRLYKRITAEDLETWQNKPLGPGKTKQELLRLLLGFTPTVIRSEIQVWEWLFHTHYVYDDVPEFLIKQALALSTAAPDELKDFAASKKPFLSYLQSAWEQFVLRFPDVKAWSGPPFSHPRIAVFLDMYFANGWLSPLQRDVPVQAPHWLKVGIQQPTIGEEALQYVERHTVELQFAPSYSDNYVAWFQELPKLTQLDGAFILAQLVTDDQVHPAEFAAVKERFGNWLRNNYASLQSATNMPLMTHHVMRWFKRDVDEGKKAILVVVDGLRLDQWQWGLRQQLKKVPELQGHVHTAPVIAWVPTVTSLARQAIFAAQSPISFNSSWKTTAQEEAFFKGHFSGYTQFFKQGQTALRRFTKQTFQDLNASVAAVVVNAVDDAVHSNASGGDLLTLYRDILQLFDNELFPLLLAFRERGYEVHITSDHGHTLAEHQVKLPATLKNFSGTRAQRTVMLDKTNLNPLVLTRGIPEMVPWAASGLPADYTYLLARPGYHFGKSSGTLIAHGGASLEEVVVPYGRIATGEAS